MTTAASLVFSYACVVANMFVLDILYAQDRYSLPVSIDKYAVARVKGLVIQLPMNFQRKITLPNCARKRHGIARV